MDKGNLKYDIVWNGRYHQSIKKEREAAQDLSGRQLQQVKTRHGIRQTAPVVAQLAPALDIVLSRSYDAPHSEWRGLGRVLQGLLFLSVLSKVGAKAYLKAFQMFHYPSHWPRIQSPLLYIWSWSLLEAGRATILCLLILRCHSEVGWFQQQYLHAVERRLNSENQFNSPRDAVIWAFGIITSCNSIIGAQRYMAPQEIHKCLLQLRQCFQKLIECAHDCGIRAVATIDTALDSNNPETMINQAIEEGIEGLENEEEDGPSLPRNRSVCPLSKWQKLYSLPNVHAGLHIADNAREFATVMNCNVLAGEMKHK